MNNSPRPQTHWKSKLKKLPGLVPLVRLCRILCSPKCRSEWLLKRAKPNNLFQPYSNTKPERHPDFFAFVREQFSTDADAIAGIRKALDQGQPLGNSRFLNALRGCIFWSNVNTHSGRT